VTTPSAPAPAPRPGDDRTLETLSGDSEQRVVASVLYRLAALRRGDRAHPRLRHWGVPAICAALGVNSYLNPHNTGDVPAQVALIAAFTIPLLWRERRPMLVFALTTAASVAALPLGVMTGSESARVVALFNVGRYSAPRYLALAVGITTVQLVAWAAVFWRGGQLEHATRPEVVTALAMTAMAAFAALGLLSRLASAYIDALRKERDQQARLAIAQERARVSREMHDILGHTLSVIVGLADGAAALTPTKPERGAQTLRIISASGRDALAELRRLLAVIGDDNKTDNAPLAPQPGLTDLNPLLDRVRAAGPTVTLHTQGDLTELPPGLQLSVYRIIQEALTNTVKYAASDTTVHVSLAVGPDAVHVTVEDTGPTRTPRTRRRQPGGGRGLVGMRERVALYKGTVTAGPNSRGGWTVHAFLAPNPPSPDLSTSHTQAEPPSTPEHRS
jgi:signal transduction histidine kinase